MAYFCIEEKTRVTLHVSIQRIKSHETSKGVQVRQPTLGLNNEYHTSLLWQLGSRSHTPTKTILWTEKLNSIFLYTHNIIMQRRKTSIFIAPWKEIVVQ